MDGFIAKQNPKENPSMNNKQATSNKKYNHFSFEEREILALELARGKSQKEIAVMLKRSPATLSREIWRNSGPFRRSYKASEANRVSRIRKFRSHQKDRLKTPEIREYVERKIKEGISPELIAGRISLEIPGTKINHESIYLYIYHDRPLLIKYLARSHRKRHKRGHKNKKRISKIPNRISINERPEIINNRTRVGDWEADTVVSRESTSALLVLRERKIHLTFIKKLKNKSAKETKKAILNILSKLPAKLRKSITFDNGTENVLHEEIAEKLELKTFFCNPYHSWEKGSVENTNGLIRRHYPKKTDFSLISDDEIKNLEDWLNNRPRKALGFYTPYEVLKDCA